MDNYAILSNVSHCAKKFSKLPLSYSHKSIIVCSKCIQPPDISSLNPIVNKQFSKYDANSRT